MLKFEEGTAIINKSYHELKIVEFIELLGRMAEQLHLRGRSTVGKAAFLVPDNIPMVK